MFSGFFYALRDEGVHVSLYEWMTLMEALSLGLAQDSLTNFYYLARCTLIKSETYFDKYDAAFAKYFKNNSAETKLHVSVINNEAFVCNSDSFNQAGLRKPKEVTDEHEALIDLLMKSVTEVKAAPLPDEKGSGELAPEGAGTPTGDGLDGAGGIRIGGDTGAMSAVKIAGRRIYKDYQDDNIRNIRQFEIALRTLRQLSTKFEGPKDELDLQTTVDETGKNAGILSLVWDRPRRNTIKVIILMDSIGSIYSYHDICKKLFNAAHRSTHFKEIKFYYFHNCIYGRIYKNQWLDMNKSIKTDEFFRLFNSDYRLLIVGDGRMALSELTKIGGIIDWSAEYNTETGLTWLNRVVRHFPYCVWLNPVPEHLWGREPNYVSINMIRDIFPMFELTPGGITKAIKRLRAKSC